MTAISSIQLEIRGNLVGSQLRGSSGGMKTSTQLEEPRRFLENLRYAAFPVMENDARWSWLSFVAFFAFLVIFFFVVVLLVSVES